MQRKDEEKANLGLATNETLIRELITRFKLDAVQGGIDASLNVDRALTLAILLGGLPAYLKEYRTVNSD